MLGETMLLNLIPLLEVLAEKQADGSGERRRSLRGTLESVQENMVRDPLVEGIRRKVQQHKEGEGVLGDGSGG